MTQNTQQVALITGAARRIGAEIARILHENGFNVVLHYHYSAVEAHEFCHSLNQKRAHSAIALSANLTNITELQSLVERATQAWERLDVLVNNASQFYKTTVSDVTESLWDDLLNTNLKAPFFLSQFAAPYLAKQNGCMVNIIDIHAEKPLRDYTVYSISKAGLVMLTKSLAQELAPAIRVNAVSPGPMVWPENQNTLETKKKSMLIERTALKREGDPRDIAKAVLYFVRDADYVTGQVLAVDAGRSLFM